MLAHPAAAFGATSLLACAALRRRCHGLRSPPEARKAWHAVKIGRVAGEDRGPDPMDPPKEKLDPYFWMRSDSRDDPEVLALLRAENAHTDYGTSNLNALRESLYTEYRARLKEDDDGAPARLGPWKYFSRTRAGKGYAIHCRIPAEGAAGEPEVVLDENEMAEGHEFCDVESWHPSPDHRLLAYAVDFKGYETYSIRFRDLETGRELPDVIPDVSGDFVWHPDGRSILYSTQDAAHRPDKVWQHVLGAPCPQERATGEDSDDSEDEDEDEDEAGASAGPQEGAAALGRVAPRAGDRLLFAETDERFWVHLDVPAHPRQIVIASHSPETSEEHLLDAGAHASPEAAAAAEDAGSADAAEGLEHRSGSSVWSHTALRCVHPREHGLRYSAVPHGDRLYLLTNADGAVSQRLVWCPLDTPGREHWRDVMRHDPAITLAGLHGFSSCLAVEGRSEGLRRVWILGFGQASAAAAGSLARETPGLPDSGIAWARRVAFDDPVHTVGLSGACVDNCEFDTATLRVSYSSPVCPRTAFDVDVATGDRRVVHVRECPGFDAARYTCRRLLAPAKDGTQVPISIVSRADLPPSKGGHPTLVYAYGSYGASMDPSFMPRRLSLLDRGAVLAIAHVRGGGEMGRHWYEEQGKFLTKRNTFDDVIACTEHLIDSGVAARDRVAIEGASAGGLTVGATLNMRPDLFCAALADVPFVDVLTTMSDPSIPLTVTEWEEWGNPNSERYYDYIRSYSPVDNVREAKYPPVLAVCGLHDSRVGYWEPLKWIHHLRDKALPGSGPFFLRAQMAGHFASSDRFAYLRDEADTAAFVVQYLGLSHTPVHE